MNSIQIKAIVNGNRIDYQYEVSGPWKEAFNSEGSDTWFMRVNGEHRFFVEYEEDMTGLPQSLAILPFLANILPMAWFYNADVYLPELDMDFYNCIPAVKAGMLDRHPNATLGGKIIPESIVANEIQKGENTIALFSGGVDATFTAISNLDSKPILATVWGADIYLKQEADWEEVISQNRETARNLGTECVAIKSSFRSFLDYGPLNEKFAKPLKMDGWWYSVQHSIALVCLAAPVAWKRHAKGVFIASSYSIEDDPETKCCNWPNIDGNVRYAGLAVTHHDFSVTRQQKVLAITEFFDDTQTPLNLRVCWKAVAASNCCDCEKCVRTIYGIIAEKHDPNNFGFRCDDATYANIEQKIRNKDLRVSSFWDAVVDRMKNNVPEWAEVSHIEAVVSAHDDAQKRLAKAKDPA